MVSRILSASVLLLSLSASAFAARSPFAGCTGSAKYRISFTNFLTKKRFGTRIPEAGLVFSPLVATSHSGRVSILSERGYASLAVRDIAEKGSNTLLLKVLARYQRVGRGVKDVMAASGPSLPGKTTILELEVDCSNSFVTVLGMVAPSPDWIAQISNINLYNAMSMKFIERQSGNLVAYDAGTDDGDKFTPPSDTTLDIETIPKKNIVPLIEDETDPFNGMVIGKYVIEKVMVPM